MHWCRRRYVSHITPIFLLSATLDIAPTMMQSFIDEYLVLSRLYSCCWNHKGAWEKVQVILTSCQLDFPSLLQYLLERSELGVSA